MSEKFFVSSAFKRYQNQLILVIFLFLTAWAISDVAKLPAAYLVQWPHLSSVNLIFLFCIGVSFLWAMKTIRIILQGYLEITDEAVVVVGRPAFTLPLSEITGWEIITSADQKITDVVLWKPGRKYELNRFAPLEKIVERLEANLPLKPETVCYHWLATYPKLFVILKISLLIGVQLIGDMYLHSFVIAIFPVLYGVWVLAYFALYQKFVLKGESLIIIFGGLFLFMALLAGTPRLKETYLSHPCSQIARLVEETGCIRYFDFDSQVLGFTPDNEALVLANPHYFWGVLVQPIHGRLPQFYSTFFAAPVGQTLAPSGHKLLAYDQTHPQLELWDVPTGQKEQTYPFLGEELMAISPAGRYFLVQQNQEYWVVESATQQQTLLPLQPRLAAFAADEQTLFLLTQTELVEWQINTQATPRTYLLPLENEIECLRFLQEGQLLLVVNKNEFWQWDLTQNKVEKRFTAFQYNCDFLNGADWVFIDATLTRLFDLNSGQVVRDFDDWGYINSWAVSPDGRYLAGSGSDFTYLFDFEFLRQQP